MAFKDLDEFFNDTLPLPVGGKVYTVAAPDAATGLWAQKLTESWRRGDGDDLNDAQLDKLYQRSLGDVYDELIDNGVSWPKIQHVGMTAFLWIAGNLEAAERYWESGGDPEALARLKNRATRRSGSTTKTSSGAARTTRKAASTNGTKTPK